MPQNGLGESLAKKLCPAQQPTPYQNRFTDR